MEKVELKNQTGKVYCTIEYKKDLNYVYANWIGFVTVENVMEGATKVLEFFKTTNCPNFINDNRQLTGPWRNANEWIETVWTPKALELGLKRFAFVVSPNIFGELSAKDLGVRLDALGFEMKSFKDFDEAESWLK
ncbi:MAG: hypothetical protein U0V72_13550 [Cytophagales bacterium]